MFVITENIMKCPVYMYRTATPVSLVQYIQ